MAMRGVNLVFGPKTRVVPVRVEGGRVNGEIIGRAMKTGEQLLGVIGHYKGKLTPANASKILGARVDTIAIADAAKITIPEMININDKARIMKAEVTVSLFKQVMHGYEIARHNADELKAILADPSKADNALTYVNLHDAREFAKRLRDLTGRKFRVQTEEEWLVARNKLSGNNWTWTEPKYSENTFVLRRLGLDHRLSYPELRYYSFAVRLVEDL